MNIYRNEKYSGERCLYNIKNSDLENCDFVDGESPLKETRNLNISNTTFRYKYPLWYSKNIICNNVTLYEMARSGVWYTKNITFNDSLIIAPKIFRRCNNVVLNNVEFKNASETFWECRNIKLNNVTAKGDYFAMNSSNIVINDFILDGNYAFDGSKHIRVNNANMKSKDSFWNCKDVVVKDSIIEGEYIGWNSKNITFINCKITSHQGFCYMKNVKLVNCELYDTDLCFEFCEDINAEINNFVVSIKNPISGVIHVNSVGELILDDKLIDKNKTKIIIDHE